MRSILVFSAVSTAWLLTGLAVFPAQQSTANPDTFSRGDAQRLVSLAPNITEILCALDLEDKLVGVSLFSDHPASVKSIRKVGTFWQPDIEAVIALRPDLVVTLGFVQQRDLAARLRRMGYRCLTVEIDTVEQLFEAIKHIGAATGSANQADKLVCSIKEQLAHIATQLSEAPRPRVLWVVQRQPLRVAGRQTFIDQIITLAGGTNAIGFTIHKYPPIGAEQVISSGADVIIETTMGQADPKQQQAQALKYWRRFANLPAVRHNRIYVVDSQLVSRLGPRLPQAVGTVAACLHDMKLNIQK